MQANMQLPKRLLHAFHGRPSSNPIKIAIVLEELGLEYEIASLSVSLLRHILGINAHFSEGIGRAKKSPAYRTPSQC